MEKSQQEMINELSDLCTKMGEKFFQVIHSRPTKAEHLTISQIKVLMFLDTKENFKMKDITEYLGIASSSATDLIDRLIKEKLVERYRHPDDRRVVRVKLSEEGRSILNEEKAKKQKFWTAMIENMEQEEREVWLRFSRKFYNIVSRMAEEGIVL